MPIIGPHLGAIIGSLFYDLFIGFHWPQEQDFKTGAHAHLAIIIDTKRIITEH